MRYVVCLLILLAAASRADGQELKTRSCSSSQQASLCAAPENCLDGASSATCYAELDHTLYEKDCQSANDADCRIYLSGEITAETASRFKAFLKHEVAAAKKHRISLILDSNGGDLDAAMAIGEALRAVQGTAVVSSHMRCASACVFVAAGGSRRELRGPMRIHRPYRANAIELGAAEAQRQFRRRNLKIERYFARMNVSPRLLDAMNAVSPEGERELTRDELDNFGLLSVDPVLQEEVTARNARREGLSMSRYLETKRAERAPGAN